MVLKSEIEKAFELQQERKYNKNFIDRLFLDKIRYKDSQIEVISGIRRCGKSTLLLQIMKKYKKTAFINFEDPRIFNFELEDFKKLDDVIGDDVNAYFFDELQNVKGWEIYIRHLHDRGKKVFITGSNATMLSKDLGTRLTGRYIRHELFPFSYKEYLKFRKMKDSSKAFGKYISEGGLPEFLRDKNPEILQTLLRDIVIRDIAVRYNIKNTKTLMDITLFLISNIGKEHTYNSLKKHFSVGSASTVSDYLSWLNDAYLLFYLPKFSWSSKNLTLNPRKVYAIDTGLVNFNSLSFTEDKGRLLENTIFLFLKQLSFVLYYFRNKGECDFVVFDNNKCKMLIQVSSEIHSDNKNREINGLLEAMNYFDKSEGFIITNNQKDVLKFKNKTINIIPANEFENMFSI
ncbi:MAG: ATP-binding protein [Chlorobi bacterium]|nr:ATP-binding protein [Chlorobiota bacterium]